MDTENRFQKEKGAEPIINSLKEAQVHSGGTFLHVLMTYKSAQEIDLECLTFCMFMVLYCGQGFIYSHRPKELANV